MSWRDDRSYRDGGRGGGGGGYGGYGGHRGRTERYDRNPRYNPRERGPRRPGGIDEGGGAQKLARVHGTELDRVNCPFFYKVGSCRHGENCSRRHNKPKFSQTLLIKHMWLNPQVQFLNVPDHQKPGEREMKEFRAKVQEGFNAFYEEIFKEVAKFGYLEAIHVSENLGDHMVGNVFIQYSDEKDAADAMEALQGRYYSGQPLVIEFSPVTDFHKARCRQYDEGVCARGGFCNYVHIRPPDRDMVRELFGGQERPAESSSDSSSSDEEEDRSRRRRRSRSRSNSRGRHRDRRSHRSKSKSPEKKDGKTAQQAAPPAPVPN